MWFKRKAFERSARAPLIIASPGQPKNQICAQPVELVDLYPTIVDQAGFSVPEKLDGLSLVPLLKDPQAQWTKPAITQVHYAADKQGYSIRTQRWRYTEWNEGRNGLELYDHSNDPKEEKNLAKEEKYAPIIAQLSERVRLYSRSYVANPKKSKKKKR